MNQPRSLLEQYTLKILEKIEFVLDTKIISNNSNKVEILFEDIDFTVLAKQSDLYSVASFLKERDINFIVTFDLINEHPVDYVTVNKQSEGGIEIGYVEFKTLSDIRKKILSLRNKLSDGNNIKDKVQLLVSKKDGIQRYLNGELLEYGMKIKGGQRKRYNLFIHLYKASSPVSEAILKNIPDGENRSSQLISKEISEMNKMFIKKLKLEGDVIVRAGSGGYELNKTLFVFKLE